MRRHRSGPLSPWERRERQDSGRLLLLVSIAVVAVVLVAFLVFLATKWNPRLSETLCPVDGTIAEEALVLLDVTDPWNPIQGAVLRQQFQELQERLPRFGRIHLYSLDPDQPELRPPLLTLCNPGKVADFERFPVVGTRGARVISNPTLLEGQWREGFVAKLDSLFQIEISRPESQSSPIMETLRGAAIEVFGTGRRSESRRTVHLFSDLLQFSPHLNLYRDPQWSAETGRRLADLSWLGTTALDGVEIFIYLVDRPQATTVGTRSRGALIELWDAFFSAQNATVVRVRRIDG